MCLMETVGGGAVGKSSLTIQFIQNVFIEGYVYSLQFIDNLI
jgi:GTPase SAR1 family protein